jgi:hypothetical protein
VTVNCLNAFVPSGFDRITVRTELSRAEIWSGVCTFLLISIFRSNMTGKSLALSGVGEWLQSGRIRASLVVLELTETHEFSDATDVWIKGARSPNGEPCRRLRYLPGHPSI